MGVFGEKFFLDSFLAMAAGKLMDERAEKKKGGVSPAFLFFRLRLWQQG